MLEAFLQQIAAVFFFIEREIGPPFALNFTEWDINNAFCSGLRAAFCFGFYRNGHRAAFCLGLFIEWDIALHFALVYGQGNRAVVCFCRMGVSLSLLWVL